MEDILHRLILEDDEICLSGRIIVGDNKFANLSFMQECRDCNVGYIAACSVGKTKHLSRMHQRTKRKTKEESAYKCDVAKWDRGESERWIVESEVCGDITFTAWNDANPCFIASNCTKPLKGYIGRREESAKNQYSVPSAQLLYNFMYHETDLQNQNLANAPLDYRTQRKQNRVMFQLMNAYIWINSYHVFLNSPNLTKQYTNCKDARLRQMKRECVRMWKRECIAANGINVMNLRMKQTPDKMEENTRDTGLKHVMIHVDPNKKKTKRRCLVCSKLTPWRCQVCKNRVKKDGYVTLCNTAVRRCYYEYPAHKSCMDID